MSPKFFIALFLLCVAILVANRYNVDQNLYTESSTATVLKLRIGSSYLPKDVERPRDKDDDIPQGEDAHFMCEAMNVIGVADGVGGWASKGIDAGEYARELMANSKTALLDHNKGSINPVAVMQSAYGKTHSKGSATALIIALNDNNMLRYANLGDSGFILFRGDKIVYRSPVQHHAFNMPYQLGTASKDTPALAHKEEIRVEDGDIIVAATDGLFDNVYPNDLEKILNLNKNDEPNNLASRIAKIALVNAKDIDYYSPFAKAYGMFGFGFQGGKYDDITVIVAKIERDMSP
ncbi:hypothetical protein M5689_007465 [Euphorbia peplus]|nr:hypothetical protein M5689_007465 [Euphorbia peplus]